MLTLSSWCVWHFIHNLFSVKEMGVMFMSLSSVNESLETLFNPRHTFSTFQKLKKSFIFLKKNSLFWIPSESFMPLYYA